MPGSPLTRQAHTDTHRSPRRVSLYKHIRSLGYIFLDECQLRVAHLLHRQSHFPQRWQTSKDSSSTARELPGTISLPTFNSEDQVTALENKQNKSLVILITVSLFFLLFFI